MKYLYMVLWFIARGVFAETIAQVSMPAKNVSPEKAQAPLNGNGLCFTPNKGQIADMNGKLCPDILYKGESGGADIYLRTTGISYVYSNMAEVMHEVGEQVEELEKSETITEANEQKKKDELLQKQNIKIHRVDMDFAGCNSNIRQVNEDQVDGYQNFYYAHCPQGITNVKQYNKVTYKNIYNNIDLSYYGDKENGIKYDLIVQPHADPNQIKLHWKGAESIRLNSDGRLFIKTSVNEFTESIPKVYQVLAGRIIDIKARYILNGTIVNFELGTWNRELPLIIDPWATYYGGSVGEYVGGLDTDNNGNVIIAGFTYSNNFPVLGSYQMMYGGGLGDSFVVKFNSTGTRLWATFYGGNNEEHCNDVTTDNAGNVYFTGHTKSTNFPVLFGTGYNQIYSGGIGGDAFVVKLNSSGTRQWASFYGGTGAEEGRGIVSDNLGNIYLTGHTYSTDFPVILGVQMALASTGYYDAFVVKFDTTGARIWATYYGGGFQEYSYDIAVDNGGNPIISGNTYSSDFPVLSGTQMALNNIPQLVSDAFIVKFSISGICLWASYFGGGKNENCYGIAVDYTNNVYITGYTQSADFPVVTGTGYIQSFGGGNYDVFIVKLNNSGVCLWATYYGGNEWDFASDIAIDSLNNIYLYMEVEDKVSPDLSTCSYQPIFNGGSTNGTPEDQIIVKFDSFGKKICSTYIGGTGHDDLDFNGTAGGGISIYGSSIFIAGMTDGGYPVTAGAFQTNFKGGEWDAFVTSLCTNICEGKILGLNFTSNTNNVCNNVPVKFVPAIQYSCDTTGYKYHWTFTGGIPASSDSINPTVSFPGTGTHDVKLVVTTLCKKDSLIKVNYITTTPCVVCNLVGQYTKGTATCAGCGCKEWLMVNATGGTGPYSYTWQDGYTNRYKNQLCPGTYTIKVTDKNNCSININLTAP